MQPSSFLTLRTKFVPEIQRLCPGTPFILVGTKSDLGEKWATEELGLRLARTVGALTYMECSALTNHGVSKVFQEVKFYLDLSCQENIAILLLLQAFSSGYFQSMSSAFGAAKTKISSSMSQQSFSDVLKEHNGQNNGSAEEALKTQQQ